MSKKASSTLSHPATRSSSTPHLLIRASAGTGKTYQLSNRFLQLLAQAVPPEQSLASPFTRKSAGEILERVMIRLAHGAIDPSVGQKLGEELGDPEWGQDQFKTILRRTARNLHRLRISTLDAFFAQLATSFSLELGFPPGWSIIEDQPDRTLRQDALQRLLASDDQDHVERMLHLITKGEATRSISELLSDTVDRLYALYLQTDQAAWRNFPNAPMLSDEELAGLADQLAAAELPADKRFDSARNADLENVRARDWEKFISKGLAKKVLEGAEVYYNKPIPADVVSLYESLLSHARGYFLKQLEHQTGATYDLLDGFDRIYRERKLAARYLRFEDVTRMLAESDLGDSLNKVHFRLDGEIRHLLLDEFQDTSYWQWQVLEPFARQVTQRRAKPSRPESPTSFFCVGDVKQAIYGWRGGKSEIFEAIERRLEGLQQDNLTRSYRSSPAVIESVNRIFQNLHAHPNLDRETEGVASWMKWFRPHSTVHAALPGHVTLETSPGSDHLSKSEQALVGAADRVAQLAKDAPGRQIGVLVRRNQSIARLIYELKERGIPASEEGGNPLTDSAGVLAMLAVLKLIDHPRDGVARFHVSQSPFGTIFDFTEWRDLDRAQRLARRLRAQLMDEGYGPSLLAWTRPVLATCQRRDASRLLQLVDLAYDYDSQATLRTVDFIEFVEMQRVADPIPADVRVMTVHQSKGLQFEIVVLTDLEWTLVGQPSSYVVDQPDVTSPVRRVCLYRNQFIQQLLPETYQEMFAGSIREKVLEALCVLYVATTRAERAMHIIIPPASPKERSLPKSASGLLRAALAADVPATESEVLYEEGDRDWHRKDGPSGQGEASEPQGRSGFEKRESKRIEFAAGRSVTRPLRSAAPSQLEGGWLVPLRSAWRVGGDESLIRGTIVHAWFEEIRWLEDGCPDADRLHELARPHRRTSLDLELLQADFRAMLERPVIRDALSRESYLSSAGKQRFGVRADEVVVENERRFAVRRDDELLSGTIDRLVLLKSGGRVAGAEIIDYKTDRLGTDREGPTLAELVRHYRPQQEAYRDAVARLYRLDSAKIRVQLLLVYSGHAAEIAFES